MSLQERAGQSEEELREESSRVHEETENAGQPVSPAGSSAVRKGSSGALYSSAISRLSWHRPAVLRLEARRRFGIAGTSQSEFEREPTAWGRRIQEEMQQYQAKLHAARANLDPLDPEPVPLEEEGQVRGPPAENVLDLRRRGRKAGIWIPEHQPHQHPSSKEEADSRLSAYEPRKKIHHGPAEPLWYRIRG